MNPQEKITAYLFANRAKIQYLTMDIVIQDVKLYVFNMMSPLSDEEIRKVVSQWAMVHAVGLILKPGGGSAPASPSSGNSSGTNSESDLVAAVKKAIATVGAGVTVGKKGANINVGVTGVTANLKREDSGASLGISWTGSLKLEANSGPFHFTGSLSKDEWEIVLSYPQDTYIPNLSTLGKVFTDGETAVRKMADVTRGLTSISDVRNVGALVKPHAEAVQKAVEAVSGIAKGKGGASFGFKLGSPPAGPGQEGIPPGVQGTFVFTYVF